MIFISRLKRIAFLDLYLFQIIFFLIFSKSVCFAQKETNFWHFGQNAGLDFSTGSPIAITNSSLSTSEGSCSISDWETGDLLFYTDGVTVYDKQNNIMSGGTGLFGTFTSAQSALIVPKPGTCYNYYIFTADGEKGSNGICYSEVDMSMNNSLGAVIAKNIQLVTPAEEKLAAVKQANGIDYWFVTHKLNTDTFYTYAVTSAGVSLTPVKSKVGAVVTENRGILTISPNGKKIASSTYIGGVSLELFDFNTTTGIVSNSNVLINGGYTWGVAFSANSSKLYSVDVGTFAVHQFDLLTSPILGSKTAVFTGNILSSSLLSNAQLALDGKVYFNLGNTSSLSVVNKPDLVGASCDFQEEALSLDGKMGDIGFPSFVATFLDSAYIHGGIGNSNVLANFSISDTSFCKDSIVNFVDASFGNPTQWSWSFGDPSSGSANSSLSQNPNHTFNSVGNYSVVLTAVGPCHSTSSSKMIQVSDCTPPASSITIPNVFTPDGNGLNDVFDISAQGYQGYLIRIYDRWGKMVFESKQASVHWDGKILSSGDDGVAGTYYYLIQLTDQNNVEETYKGYLTLIR